jgi:hypothetical protein
LAIEACNKWLKTWSIDAQLSEEYKRRVFNFIDFSCLKLGEAEALWNFICLAYLLNLASKESKKRINSRLSAACEHYGSLSRKLDRERKTK